MKGTVILMVLAIFTNLKGWTQIGYTETGLASFYGKKFHGKKTACGEKFNMAEFTAAHKKLAFQSIVKVTNLTNQKEVIVRINDRGPFIKGKIIDLSYAAAEKIGIIQAGIARVKIEVLALDGEFPEEDSLCIPDEDILKLNRIQAYKSDEIYNLEGTSVNPVGYTVQIGSYTQLKNVLKEYIKLKNAGISEIFTEVEKTNGKKTFKILIGEFLNEETAREEKTKLKEVGYEGFVRKYEQEK